MKKWRAIILFMVFLIIALAACSQPTIPLTPTTTIAISPAATPTITPIPSPTPIPPLPEGIGIYLIDGVKTSPEIDPYWHTWVWRNKKGEIRRLFDPISQHILVRASSSFDRLTFDIDFAFKWEVNLVNYLNYRLHSPFGSGYIRLLKAKFPQSFPQANENTGVLFRIINGALADIQDQSEVTTAADLGTEKERVFLKPLYNAATDEYIFRMYLRKDFLTKKGAINTYTDWMLNYCISPQYPENPSGSWGIEVYKHRIK